MKVLHIIPSLKTGGAERLVLDICTELTKRKDIEVKLYIFHDIKEFGDYSFIKHVSASIRLSMHSKNKFEISNLEREVIQFSPDIIHSHLFEAEIVSRSISYPHAKWFTHFHDNMPQFQNFKFRTLTKRQLLTNFYEKLFLSKRYKKNNGTTFISISKDTKDYVETSLNRNSYLLYNAINLEKFSSTKSKKENDLLRLINIGSFQAKKNQQFLVDIVKELKKQRINVRLDLFGTGEKFEEVKEKIRVNNLECNIILHGNVNNVEDYIKQSDIYVHSAYYEPFGLVLVEAMAGGLPIVVLDGKGNRDLIVKGKNGYMIYQQDAKLFSKKIIEIWGNRMLYNEMSTFAQQYSKQFGIRDYVNKLLTLYKDKTLSTKIL